MRPTLLRALALVLLPGLASAASFKGGEDASRIIVSMRTTTGLAGSVPGQNRIEGLSRRAGINLRSTRDLSPNLSTIVLEGAWDAGALATALAKLQADPEVEFVELDQRRYARAMPNDPLYSSQWYLHGVETAATNFTTAWDTTTGAADTVVAVLDTGVRFEHPDLAGRLLPGYDFVSGESAASFASANDGNGWDPDASDPGDWVSTAESQSGPLAGCFANPSSWHGTRIAAMIGAATNNGAGISGGTWSGKVLPVRVLGKCGGYDSDIIVGMRWAAGLPVPGVPLNPNPAQILNLGLGGASNCSLAYGNVITELTGAGVLVIASAGNGGGVVDAPANCTGVLAVAGLRHVGTKAGYSSFGSQISVAAPAGNCPSAPLLCEYSLITATNAGLTAPTTSTYTDDTNDNSNIGTSFSSPIVSAVAGLMYGVNDGLAPAEFIARIKSGARPFPPPQVGLPTCPNVDSTTGQCNCTTTTCGAGILDAPGAIAEALRPIARIVKPAGTGAGQNVVLNGSGSAAARGRTINAYAWTAVSGNPVFVGGTNGSTTTVAVPPSGQVRVRLTVTDNVGRTDAQVATLGADVDTDGDGIFDASDNCKLVSNPTQLDANHDGYGNLCDGDFNNSGLTTAQDDTVLRSVLNRAASASPTAAAADMNGSGLVTVQDDTLLRIRLNTAPGPSGLACAGTIPCP